MTLTEIKAAVESGCTVHWSNNGYTVVKDRIGQWFIKYVDGHLIGLTRADGVTMNGKPQDFYVEGVVKPVELTREEREAKAHHVMVNHLHQLVGKTVESVIYTPPDAKTYTPGIYGLNFTDGSVAWILQDPEGNGPGHLDIHKPILEKKARRK